MMNRDWRPIISDKNHWCSINAEDIELLIDAKAYYEDFFDSCKKAQEKIVLAGWVMEDRLLLSKHDDRLPDSLVEFFKSLSLKKPELIIETIVWTPGFYLDFSRQAFKESRWSDKLPSNFRHFRDKSSYLFGSRHEKYALIDGHTLFVGGMDITSGRYDNRDHDAQFHRRLPGGKKYRPRHDAQLKITGPINKKIRELRNRGLPSKKSKSVSEQDHGQIEGVTKVYLSRTSPELKKFEIEDLYVQAINKARDWIYIENQYFTNAKIAEAIVRRLKEKDPPEIVMALPMTYGGVFERAIFEHKRNLLLGKVRKADHKNRFRAYYPSIPNETKDSFVVVHSKLMAVDGRFFTIGSANLNERSMRVDTELNASIESLDLSSDHSKFIYQSVSDLLGEHLETSAGLIANDLSSIGLMETIRKNIKRGGRAFRPIKKRPFKWWERAALLISSFIDIKLRIPKHGQS